MGCAACGKGTVRLGRTNMKRSIAGHIFAATVQARTCTHCGEVFFEDADVERVDLAVASALVASGIASGAAFKFVRKVVGIRAAELARLLSVTPETVSRWETDKVPIDYGAKALLAMMLDDRMAEQLAPKMRCERFPNPSVSANGSRSSWHRNGV